MEHIFNSIITFLVSTLCLLLILLFFVACSDKSPGYGEFVNDTGDETPVYTFEEIAEKIKDLPPLANSATIPNLEFQYMQDCYQEEWYFCPPLDAVWQFKLVTDICKDPPQIIELGPCEEKLECDPSNDTVEIIECLVDDQQGSQQKWCEKGVWKYSDCNPCFDEICDNLDNDCDGEIDEDILIVPCETPCGLGDLICVDGMEICIGPDPEEEICDYKDNDCDADTDEDFGMTQNDGTGITGGVGVPCGVGVCAGGTTECNSTGSGIVCSTESAGSAAVQTFDLCDYQDNDCDGETDESFPVFQECDGNDPDACAEGVLECNFSGTSVVCAEGPIAYYDLDESWGQTAHNRAKPGNDLGASWGTFWHPTDGKLEGAASFKAGAGVLTGSAWGAVSGLEEMTIAAWIQPTSGSCASSAPTRATRP